MTAGEAITAWNTRAPQEPQWQKMTPETKFEDGEWVCFKFLNGDVWVFRYCAGVDWFKKDGATLFMDTAQELKFVRLSK